MSEEEKLLNDLKDYLNYLKGKNLMTSFRFNIVDLLENSISLIEKQQKEIDRLNRKQADDEMLKDTFIERDYISRNKIREKIKNIENLTFEENSITRDYILTILEELLEE